MEPLTPDQIQLFKDVGTAAAIVGFQAYNVLQHRRNVDQIKQTKALVTTTYDDIQEEIRNAHAAIERIAVKVIGADRRAAPAPGDPTSAAAQNLARRRWSDQFPRYPMGESRAKD